MEEQTIEKKPIIVPASVHARVTAISKRLSIEEGEFVNKGKVVSRALDLLERRLSK